MKIVLNNEETQLTGISELTVEQLLKIKNFTFKMLVVKVNDKVIRRDDYKTTPIYEGDVVAVVHLISGG